ncbi:hypothetical protein RUM43_008129 [Polyplax serrata]|uniref:Uncharacterized protein n=1 Tax=Polyplax serrata TaxID=468196 RepID=A0AAN8P6X1_POLSC
MFKRSDIGVNNSKNLKLSGNVIPNSVSSVEEDLRILDRILDDIENIGDDNYVDTMLDCGNKKKESHSNSKNSTHLKRNVGKVEEVQKLVVEKKLTATEQSFLSENLTGELEMKGKKPNKRCVMKEGKEKDKRLWKPSEAEGFSADVDVGLVEVIKLEGLQKSDCCYNRVEGRIAVGHQRQSRGSGDVP